MKYEIAKILQSIQQLNNLRKLTITMKLSRKNIKSINSLKDLEYLHIIEAGCLLKRRNKHVKKLYKPNRITHITQFKRNTFFL